jgi:hypothetical protein
MSEDLQHDTHYCGSTSRVCGKPVTEEPRKIEDREVQWPRCLVHGFVSEDSVVNSSKVPPGVYRFYS